MNNEKLEVFALEFSEYMLNKSKSIRTGDTKEEALINKGRVLECIETIKVMNEMFTRHLNK